MKSAAVLLLACALSHAQGLTGYYDRQAAILRTSDGLEAAAQLEAEAAAEQSKIEAIRIRLKSEEAKLHQLESGRHSWFLWRSRQKRSLTAHIAADTHGIPSETERSRALIERDRALAMGIIARRLDQTIGEYARLNGFAHITDAGARAAYSNLTYELIRRYDWKFPASASLIPNPPPASASFSLSKESVVDHLNVRVSDVERSARFYTSLFGGDALALSTSARPDYPVSTAIVLHFGGRVPNLYLSQASPEHPPGLDHLAVGVTDVPLAERKVREAGLRMEYPGSNLWVRDPAGTYLHDMPIAPWSVYQKLWGSKMRNDLESPAPLFRSDGIAAVTLRAANPAAVAAFWVRLFGSPAHSLPRSVDFALAKTTIDFDESLSSPAEITVEIPDLNALAAQHQLESRGIAATRAPHGTLKLHDPDGFALRLVK